jgi:exopolysaccharide biosynthesis polyprenyl glycosylphosphotransferase
MTSTASLPKTTLRSPVRHQPLAQASNLAKLLLFADVLGLVCSWQVVYWARFSKFLSLTDPIFIGFSVIMLVGLYLAEAYRPNTQTLGLRAPARIVVSGIFTAIALAGFINLSGIVASNATLGRATWGSSFLLFMVWAVMLRLWAGAWMKTQAEQLRWIILGSDRTALQFAQESLEKDVRAKFSVVVESFDRSIDLMKSGFQCIERDEFLDEERSPAWAGLLMSDDLQVSDVHTRQLMDLRLQGVPIYRLPDFYEALCYKLPAALLKDNWFIFSTGFNLLPSGFNTRLKRIVDVVFSGILLLLVSPIMLLTAVLIKLDSRGPVFYSQIRTGISNHPFRVYKFRSMRTDAETQGAQWASKSDSRITKVGQFIRLTRIDELPQFWNVLKGDMSLVGPRPERPEFDVQLAAAIPYYDIRYLVKPGITGWAQVMYPYGASVEDAYEKLAYDLYYIKNYSFWLDIGILFKTVRVVLLGKGR